MKMYTYAHLFGVWRGFKKILSIPVPLLHGAREVTARALPVSNGEDSSVKK